MYLKEQKEIISGVISNYLCHIQDVKEMGIVYPAHYHDYIEILYGISGAYKVLLNGKYHTFTSGDLVLINSKEVHQIQAISQKRGKYIVLRFDPEIIYNNMFNNYLHLKYVLPFILEDSKHEKVIKKESIEDSSIPSLIYEILREDEHENYGYELAIKNHIGRIFLWILRYFHNTSTHFMKSHAKDIEFLKRLQPSFDYVLEHFNEDVKATDMAFLCNISSSYFSRLFNEKMGMNFNEYLNYVRIMESEKLLITTSMNITEIANAVGYNTTSYFIKLFKGYKSIPPKQFRKQYVNSLYK